MKYITKGEPNIGSLPYKVDLTDDIVTIPKRTPTAGDYVLYDKVNQELVCISSSADLSNYPSESYTPIGIVVIPASHNVYGDDSCGIISLRPMDYWTPSIGGNSEQGMYWGVYDTNISALPDLDRVPFIGTGSNVGDVNSTVIGYQSSGCIPSDKFSAVQCPHDTDAYYYTSVDIIEQAPSPYLTDGSRNPAYYQTTPPSSTDNCLADFDGIGNTAKIIAQRGIKDYSSWKPSYNSEDDYQAASCCDMFYTEGTQQGDWYLPAMGELGYIMPPFNKINKAITKIKFAYSSYAGIYLQSDRGYWSSTEDKNKYARSLYIPDGSANRKAKNDNKIYVRAFLRAGGTSKISLKVI